MSVLSWWLLQLLQKLTISFGFLWQNAEEGQGRGGGHQTREGSGGREGHVLCKEDYNCVVLFVWFKAVAFI